MKEKSISIFLDIDGVLNNSSQWKNLYQLNNENIDIFIDLIKQLSKKYNVSIILSSTWKNGFVKANNSKNTPQIKELEDKLAKYGISITAKTPSYKNKSRDVEIMSYQKYYDSDYALILDDSPEEFSIEYKKTAKINNILMYYTNSSMGLTDKDVKNIIKMMK